MKWFNSLFTRLVIICAVLYFSAPIFAGRGKEDVPDFCIHNESEYNQHKDKLPKYFQSLPSPVVLGGEKKVFGFDIIAVVKLSMKNGVLVFSSDLWKLGSRYEDKVEIHKVCIFSGAKKMVLTFNNKTVYEANYSDTEFIAEDFPLRSLSASDQKSLGDKIRSKEESKTGQKIPAADEVTR